MIIFIWFFDIFNVSNGCLFHGNMLPYHNFNEPAEKVFLRTILCFSQVAFVASRLKNVYSNSVAFGQ